MLLKISFSHFTSWGKYSLRFTSWNDHAELMKSHSFIKDMQEELQKQELVLCRVYSKLLKYLNKITASPNTPTFPSRFLRKGHTWCRLWSCFGDVLYFSRFPDYSASNTASHATKQTLANLTFLNISSASLLEHYQIRLETCNNSVHCWVDGAGCFARKHFLPVCKHNTVNWLVWVLNPSTVERHAKPKETCFRKMCTW